LWIFKRRWAFSDNFRFFNFFLTIASREKSDDHERKQHPFEAFFGFPNHV
jgi:hypothetical protein